MTTVYLKSCPHCGGAVELRTAGGLEAADSLVALRCGVSPVRQRPGRPHGRPVVYSVGFSELERRLGR